MKGTQSPPFIIASLEPSNAEEYVKFVMSKKTTIDSSSVKLRLHYNESAQRTATVWRYLAFGVIRWYTLKKSDECDH